MNKKYVFTALVISISLLVNAQITPAIQWEKNLGGSGFDVAYITRQTFDGGYIVAGNTISEDSDVTVNHGGGDEWIVKLNSIGTIQWQKSLGGINTEDAYDIQQTSDSGYIIAGDSYSNDGDVSGNHGNYDCWIVKIGSTGVIQWQKSFGGSGRDAAVSIVQTSDGGYIAGGLSYSNDGDVSGNHGDQDAWIIKINSTGTLQWQKSLGGNKIDVVATILQTSDDGYIIGGSSRSDNGDVSGNHGNADYWIVKLNNAGIIQWQKCLGGSNDDYDILLSLTTDGGYIAVGFSASNDGDVSGNHGGDDYWIVKLNSGGIIQWQKSLGGTGMDEGSYINQTSDGGYIVAGISPSSDGDISGNHGSDDYWIVKLDSGGIIQWQKSLGGTGRDVAYSIQQTSDNGYIIGGYSKSNNGNVTRNYGSADYWIVKLGSDIVLPVTFLNFLGEVNNNQNILHWTIANEYNNTGFEIQHSSDGNNFFKIGFAFTKAINGSSASRLSYNYTCISFVYGTNYYRLKQIDKDGKFSYSNIVVLKNNNPYVTGLSVYPSPAKNVLNVKISSTENIKTTLLVIDGTGKLIMYKAINTGNGESIIPLDISHLLAGTYLLKMKGRNGKTSIIKFIKE